MRNIFNNGQKIVTIYRCIKTGVLAKSDSQAPESEGPFVNRFLLVLFVSVGIFKTKSCRNPWRDWWRRSSQNLHYASILTSVTHHLYQTLLFIVQ